VAYIRRVSRRAFLEQLTYGAGAAALGTRALDAQTVALPRPSKSGIDHVVVVMMENRSFDHMLGWLPGADGRQSGLSYVDHAGVSHPIYPLAPDYQGCGHPDPDHSYAGGRIELNNGACDGWLLAGANDLYAIGFYTQADLPFFAGAAMDWTTCDRYFSGMMAPTFPNRFVMHAAQTDRLTNSFELSTLPTIWDRLAAAGLSGRYYFSDVPFLALWGPKYLSISRPFSSFLLDCARGTLPHVSFVEPRFIGAELGVSNDDHPFADVRDGQVFLNLIYSAVTRGRAWRRTLLVICYDEWGGFYDHVAPSAAPIPPASAAAGDLDGLRGFRVPCLVVSAYARRRTVSHLELDHTSVLRFIEWRWGLAPLTERDRTATNLGAALNFRRRNTRAPGYLFPPGPYATPCLQPSVPDKWMALQALARSYGWPI
jgi:phospholipase C